MAYVYTYGPYSYGLYSHADVVMAYIVMADGSIVRAPSCTVPAAFMMAASSSGGLLFVEAILNSTATTR